MQATNRTEAKQLFVGAVARLLLGHQVTFVGDEDKWTTPELRITKADRDRFMALPADPYHPVDAFRTNIVSIETRYIGSSEFEGEFDDFDPIGMVRLMPLVESARNYLSTMDWGYTVPEPDKEKIRHGATLLKEKLGITHEDAMKIARDFLMGEIKIENWLGHTDTIPSDKTTQGLTFEKILGLDNEQLAELGLPNVFNVDATTPDNERHNDLRARLILNFADAFGIKNIYIDDANPMESYRRANTPGSNRYATVEIVESVGVRLNQIVCAKVVAKFDAAQAFHDSIYALQPQSFHYGKFLEKAVARPMVAGK